MFKKIRVRKSEALQLILLDNLYAQSGSEHIIFQGGTALRWIYSGMRFSEDLDFVTHMQAENLEKMLSKMFQNAKNACIAQFGPGQSEYKIRGVRKQATRVFFIYRPENQRDRVAVKLEFETLKAGHGPEFDKYILRDLPLVAGMVTGGELIIPYSSSIVLAETPEEILSDKIRAIYERKFLKGRDIYDIWWIVKQLKVVPEWIKIREKFFMYQTSFIPAREAGFFQRKGSISGIANAMKIDLPRFIPRDILSIYQGDDFRDFITVLKEVTSGLLDQGMKKYFEDHERRKNNT
ncbi:MAG: nucleotidyl transferase AbiEii/AbiGii toxin family protein [Thermodesulfobacteriota bacterium]|nr:nucleotidyl transferase AbiEii/AbiGii toxin family protein [Thermodesulfobacteriota bacterium]